MLKQRQGAVRVFGYYFRNCTAIFHNLFPRSKQVSLLFLRAFVKNCLAGSGFHSLVSPGEIVFTFFQKIQQKFVFACKSLIGPQMCSKVYTQSDAVKSCPKLANSRTRKIENDYILTVLQMAVRSSGQDFVSAN